MKRWLAWCFAVWAVVLLVGCGLGSRAYEVERDGRTFFVNPQEHTVSWDGETVTYATGSDETADWVELTYPDGATFRRAWQDGRRIHTSGAGYDPTRDVPGEVLLEVLSREVPTGEMDSWMAGVAVGLFFLGLGGFYVLRPEHALYQRTRGIGPADGKNGVARKLTRALGGAGMAVGAAILLWSLLSLN
ncbi:MAG: hypothetical protein AB7E30_03005 [Lawsonibacter sp.]